MLQPTLWNPDSVRIICIPTNLVRHMTRRTRSAAVFLIGTAFERRFAQYLDRNPSVDDHESRNEKHNSLPFIQFMTMNILATARKGSVKGSSIVNVCDP